MLRREYVVVERALEEVGVARVVGVGEELLGELEHVIGVAGLYAFVAYDELTVLAVGGEPLAHGVAAHGYAAVAGHVVPEEAGCLAEVGGVVLLVGALEAKHFGHLRVGVHVVDGRGAVGGHAVEQPAVGVAAGGVEVALVAGHLVGVGKHLVDAAVLMAEDSLHLLVAEAGYEAHAPVAEAQEHAARGVVVAVEPRVAQAGEGLVHVVERHPRRPVELHVATRKGCPQLARAGHAAEVAVHYGVGRCVPRVLAVLQSRHKAVHALFQLCLQRRVGTRAPGYGEGGEVVAAHMAVEALPVVEGGAARGQAGLFFVGLQQASGVVAEEHAVVEHHGVAEGAVGDGDVVEVEHLGVKLALRAGSERRCGHCGQYHVFLHGYIIVFAPQRYG